MLSCYDQFHETFPCSLDAGNSRHKAMKVAYFFARIFQLAAGRADGVKSCYG